MRIQEIFNQIQDNINFYKISDNQFYNFEQVAVIRTLFSQALEQMKGSQVNFETYRSQFSQLQLEFAQAMTKRAMDINRMKSWQTDCINKGKQNKKIIIIEHV